MRTKLGRRWVLAGVLTMVVALGVFGGTVLARQARSGPSADSITAGPTGHAGTGPADILERTAEKLGIDAEELKAAEGEARTELRQEAADARLEAYLDRLVENGTLTEEEAEEYRMWYETRPSFLPGSGFGGTFFFRSFGDGGFEQLDTLFDGPRLRRFRSGGFRFFFGPHGGDSGSDETVEAPVDGTSA